MAYTIDFTKPVTTDLRANVLLELQAHIQGLSQGYVGATFVTIPAGTIRYNNAAGQYESYSGSAWVLLPQPFVNLAGSAMSGLLLLSADPVAALGASTKQYTDNGLATKQPNLGFTAVQQGSGIGQTSNLVKIGYSAASKPKLTIDTTDLGYIAMETSVAATYLALSGGTITGGLTVNGVLSGATAVNINSAGTTAGDFTSGSAQQMIISSSGSGGTATAANLLLLRPGSFALKVGLDTDNIFKVGGYSDGSNVFRFGAQAGGALFAAGKLYGNTGNSLTGGGNGLGKITLQSGGAPSGGASGDMFFIY